mmetsp:Transcript_5965/g.15858  ORF Transcript_5965/g.15858 Transcript_5965/m.15858 type:complete len:119 (-) Transcript_5965:1654-2010(-)
MTLGAMKRALRNCCAGRGQPALHIRLERLRRLLLLVACHGASLRCIAADGSGGGFGGATRNGAEKERVRRGMRGGEERAVEGERASERGVKRVAGWRGTAMEALPARVAGGAARCEEQ